MPRRPGAVQRAARASRRHAVDSGGWPGRPVRHGRAGQWTRTGASSEFGFSVHYDSDDWVIQENDKDLLQLISPSDSSGSERDDWVIIEGVPAASATPQQLIDARVASLAKSVPDLAADPTPTTG